VIGEPMDDDTRIKILAAPNPVLMDLQCDIVALYGEFRDYRKPELEQYEKNFKPHLTIIHKLDVETFNRARADVQADFRCQGVIEEVVLAVVNDASIEEALNPKNLTIARL